MALRTFARSALYQPRTYHINQVREAHTRLRPRRSNSNIQRPNLPTNLLLPLPGHPRQPTKPHPGPPPLLLIELDRYPTAHAATPTIENIIAARSGGGKVLADERGDAGVDEGFEIDVVDGGEGEV